MPKQNPKKPIVVSVASFPMTKAGRHRGDDCLNKSIGTNHEDKRCSFPDRRESPGSYGGHPPQNRDTRW
ncbi:hypothetical protein HanRHA438_Chr03g0146051 [Helianthus annuus]|nr:hypothetical protein HanRHA438_Chr03g0146051 [Helianthus annuus]